MQPTRLKIALAICAALVVAVLLSFLIGPGQQHYPYGGSAGERPPHND